LVPRPSPGLLCRSFSRFSMYPSMVYVSYIRTIYAYKHGMALPRFPHAGISSPSHLCTRAGTTAVECNPASSVQGKRHTQSAWHLPRATDTGACEDTGLTRTVRDTPRGPHKGPTRQITHTPHTRLPDEATGTGASANVEILRNPHVGGKAVPIVEILRNPLLLILC
jgi:hypothetical protein